MHSVLSMMSKMEQETIHETSLQLLEEVGVVIGSENVRKMLEAKGAKVIGENVRFPKAMTEEMLGLIVHTFPIGAYTEAYRKQVPSITHPFSTTAGYVTSMTKMPVKTVMRQRKTYANFAFWQMPLQKWTASGL